MTCKNAGTNKSFLLLAVSSLFTSHVAIAQDNPFGFKEPVPVVEQPPAPIIVQSDTLSDSQKDQVKEMLMSAIKALEIEAQDVDTSNGNVTVDGKDYVILFEGDRYIGMTSGMHVIYSSVVDDYEYYDSQRFTGVMSEARYKQVMEERSMRRLESAAEKLGIATKETFDALTTSSSSEKGVDVEDSSLATEGTKATDLIKIKPRVNN